MRTCEMHNEAIVVYDSPLCPYCDLVSECGNLDDEIEGLRVTIAVLEKKIHDREKG